MQRLAIPLILAAAATVAASPGNAQGISQDTGAQSYGAQAHGSGGGPPTAAAVKTSAGGPAASAGAKAVKPVVKVGVPRGEIKLPQILKSGDVARYRRIFALQARGQYRAADREIAQLSDRILLGHVLFQRYMGRGYRARYAQLRSWMARYADHPDSVRIYKL
ncbi:MAG: hypothetical protein OEQ29_12470, partial [Alphaproteobacteria bacterium]|nr:hypothetical protein [Alphaproteobacteria bacterium]